MKRRRRAAKTARIFLCESTSSPVTASELDFNLVLLRSPQLIDRFLAVHNRQWISLKRASLCALANWFHSSDALLHPEGVSDRACLRELVGEELYDRVMLWDDSGAAEALQASEQRRMARQRRKPCWVPKLKSDLYIGPVDWESEEVCDVPQSAVALADLSQDREELPPADIALETPQGEQQSVQQSGPLRSQAFEPATDELSLIKPTGWGDVDAKAGVLLFSTLDSPVLVDSVLEDSADGQRLLIGGWPVQPTGWDQTDTSWPQAKAKSAWEGIQYCRDSLYGFYEENYLTRDHGLGKAPQYDAEKTRVGRLPLALRQIW